MKSYLGCAAPPGLKQKVFLFTHRSRSGLRLLHPDGVSLYYRINGVLKGWQSFQIAVTKFLLNKGNSI